ncbi:hypothetical protein EV356DRAFT_450867 [Viridothelium virens]|uniref:HOOK N-terminal domain-containing protein n=1 Tax=Viridothelium virens TaxID=1048519 RepID=A0A6A6H3E3_VIRVR|nr:hypothetical protein EV356DRAFT_450867 [Viridothelium virens]
MDAYTPELASALLKWVNTFDFGEPIRSWSNLRDGQRLWKILQDIDSDYFSGPLPDEGQKLAKEYVLRLQNIKHIERSAARYIGQKLGRLPHTVNKLCPHLDGVAGDGVAQEAPKLVMAILLCAMYSPESNQRMVGRLQRIGQDAGIAIATKIEEIEKTDQKTGNYFAETNNGVDHDALSTSETIQASRGPSFEVDMELQKEESLIQAYKLIDELREKNSSKDQELVRLREQHSKLEEELAEYRLLNQGKSANTDEIAYLSSQATKDRNHIASLESELSTSQAELETKSRQLDLLKAKSDSVSELRDQLQLLKAERDELIQHKNANENLKKKIQTLQDQVRNDEFLRDDLQSAREQLQDYDKIKEDRDALLKANEEKSKVIANCEQEIFDSKSTKKRLEADIKSALQRYESMKERQQRDHETIQELQDRLETDQGSAPQGLGNLDEELSARDETVETRAKAAESKPAVSGNAEVELLRQRVAAVEARNNSLETDYLDVYQDKLGLETALNDLKDHKDLEASHPFLHQREQLQALQKETTDKQEEIFRLQAELAQVKAANDLTLSKEDEYQKLSTDIEEQRATNSSLNVKLDEKEALLKMALSNANALQRGTDAQDQDFRLILAQLEAARDNTADETILQGTATKLADRLEEGREMVKEATKVNAQVHASELNDKTLFVLINSPRKPWVEHAPSGSMPSTPSPPKPARKSWFGTSGKAKARPVSELAAMGQLMPQEESVVRPAKLINQTLEAQRAELNEDRVRALQLEIEDAKKNGGDKVRWASQEETENLKRENALMTSAWYDLSSRLQMNTMALQRRNEQPRSWLGKQRVLVNKSQVSRERPYSLSFLVLYTQSHQLPKTCL